MMVNYRTVLAGLIALAIALAPVAPALAGAHALAMPAMEDCHGQPQPSSADDGCCDAKAKCPDTCGVTCCKPVGVIGALAEFHEPAVMPELAADPRQPPGWQLRPRPPPPRA
jgi:hypothetical protein